jgi:hypothetical protein
VTHSDAQIEALRQSLMVGLGAAGVGLAGRGLLGVLSKDTYPTASPRKIPRIIVPLPAPPEPEEEEDDVPSPGALRLKRADDAADVAGQGLGATLSGFDLHAPAWLHRNLPGLARTWDEATPDQTPVTGDPASPTLLGQAPWYPTTMIGAAAGGGAAGWLAGDRLLRFLRKGRAESELSAARRAYNQRVVAGYQDAGKVASIAEVPIDPDAARAREALERVWDKAANDDAGKSLLARLFLPATNFGPFGAAATVGVGATSALMAGLYGYNRMRQQNPEYDATRKALRETEEEDEMELPPVVVGEVTRPPASLARRMALARG